MAKRVTAKRNEKFGEEVAGINRKDAGDNESSARLEKMSRHTKSGKVKKGMTPKKK